ncbi:MAG: hypothetical protein ACE5GT_03690, partial [Rhodospirillales bacterium]
TPNWRISSGSPIIGIGLEPKIENFLRYYNLKFNPSAPPGLFISGANHMVLALGSGFRLG